MGLVLDGAEHGILSTEGVGPGWRFVALGGCACEENIIEIWIIDMQFVGTDSNDWAICDNRQNTGFL